MITVNFGTAAFATALTIFAPSLAIPPCSNVLTNHKAGDVLQENEGNITLGAKLDEMCRLESALRKQNTVIADDADRIAPDAARTRRPPSVHTSALNS